MPPCKTIFKI